MKSGYLLLVQGVAPCIHQRGAGRGGSEGRTAKTGHRGVPADGREIGQLEENRARQVRFRWTQGPLQRAALAARDLTFTHLLCFRSFKKTISTNILWNIRNKDRNKGINRNKGIKIFTIGIKISTKEARLAFHIYKICLYFILL